MQTFVITAPHGKRLQSKRARTGKPTRAGGLLVCWSQRQESARGCAARPRCGSLAASLRAALENAPRFLSSAPATGFDSGPYEKRAGHRWGTRPEASLEPATGIEPATQ